MLIMFLCHACNQLLENVSSPPLCANEFLMFCWIMMQDLILLSYLACSCCVIADKILFEPDQGSVSMILFLWRSFLESFIKIIKKIKNKKKIHVISRVLAEQDHGSTHASAFICSSQLKGSFIVYLAQRNRGLRVFYSKYFQSRYWFYIHA